VNRLAQFLQYTQKVFELKRLLRSVRDGRSEPAIPILSVSLCLVLGIVTRIASYLDLAEQTKRRRWRRLCGLKGALSGHLPLRVAGGGCSRRIGVKTKRRRSRP
jgi:hypothetical protein